jgi:hypothetical protein
MHSTKPHDEQLFLASLARKGSDSAIFGPEPLNYCIYNGVLCVALRVLGSF